MVQRISRSFPWGSCFLRLRVIRFKTGPIFITGPTDCDTWLARSQACVPRSESRFPGSQTRLLHSNEGLARLASFTHCSLVITIPKSLSCPAWKQYRSCFCPLRPPFFPGTTDAAFRMLPASWTTTNDCPIQLLARRVPKLFAQAAARPRTIVAFRISCRTMLPCCRQTRLWTPTMIMSTSLTRMVPTIRCDGNDR